MSTIQIRICTENASFDEDLSGEVRGIVNAPDFIDRLAEAELNESIPLFDSRGERCGRAWTQHDNPRQKMRNMS